MGELKPRAVAILLAERWGKKWIVASPDIGPCGKVLYVHSGERVNIHCELKVSLVKNLYWVYTGRISLLYRNLSHNKLLFFFDIKFWLRGIAVIFIIYKEVKWQNQTLQERSRLKTWDLFCLMKLAVFALNVPSHS